MASEIRIRKQRTTHQIVTVLMVFLMGVALGWVLRGGPGPTEDPDAPMETSSVTTGESGDGPPPGETPPPEESSPAELAAIVPPSSGEPDASVASPRDVPIMAEPDEETTAESAPEEILEDVWPGRHLIIALSGTTLSSEAKTLLAEIKPGGVVLLKGNIENRTQTTKLVESIKEAVGLGQEIHDLPLVAVDQEGGVVNRLNLESAPGAPELGAKRDAEAARNAGQQFAKACRDRGIGILFAPVLDVTLPGAPEIIKARSFGKDIEVVGAIGLAFADGAMQGGALSIAKHYPGHGAAKQDSHTMLAVIDLKEGADLAKVLHPFAQAVVAGIPGIMVGHIAVPRLDEGYPHRPASLSPRLVREFLRERWEFQGVIVSDDIAMAAAAADGNIDAAAVQALAAGCDAVVLADPSSERIRGVCAAIEAAVNAGTLSLQELNDSKRRLDALQAWLKEPKGLPGEIPKLLEQDAAPTVAEAEVPAPAEPQPEATAEESAATSGEPVSEEAVAKAEPEPEAAAASPVPPEDVKQEQPAAPAPAETAAEPTPAPEIQKPTYHEVKPGDTLTRLASRYGVSIDDLKTWNKLEGEKILLGQKLKVSPPG